MRRWRLIALASEPRISYADSSALVKLVLDEPETAALAEYFASTRPALVTSRIAVVEVGRALRVANASLAAEANARELLTAATLVDVGRTIVQVAAHIASETIRTLDAIHLATLQLVDPDEVLVYDRRLGDAVRSLGYTVIAPGA